MDKDGARCLVLCLKCHPCVSCKRVRLVVPSATQPEGSTDIHCLPDELLADVLYRLRYNKSVIRCKCVCKYWRTLVSRPDFIHELDKRNTRASCHFIFRMRPTFLADKKAALYKTDFLFSIENLSLSFVSVDRNGETGRMVGACHDLVLYCRHNDAGKCYEFYIKNMQNRQRIQLPSSSFDYDEPIKHVMFGFVCDSPGNGKTWKYSVVVVRLPRRPVTQFPAHFLLSTNGNKWCEKTLSLPKPCVLYPIVKGQSLQGKHLFGSYSGPFLIDPYPEESNKVIECPLLSWPPKARLDVFPFMGVCNGNLLFSFISYKESRIWVWLLKDENLTSEWCLLHSVAKQDLVRIDPLLKDRPFDKPWSIGCVLGFDPINSDLIYTLSARDFQLWDLRNKTLRVLSFLDMHPKDNEFAGFTAFSTSLPSLPTPIIPLQ